MMPRANQIWFACWTTLLIPFAGAKAVSGLSMCIGLVVGCQVQKGFVNFDASVASLQVKPDQTPPHRSLFNFVLA